MDAEELELYQTVIRAKGSIASTRAWMRYLRKREDPRAEFIQTQLLIANAAQRDNGYLRLVKQEQDLLAEYRQLWAPENCREICTAVRYRNGMAVGLIPPWIYYNKKNATGIRFIENFGILLLNGTGFSSRGGEEGNEPVFSVRATGVYDFMPDLQNVMLTGPATFPLPQGACTCTVDVDSRFCQITNAAPVLQQYVGAYDRLDTLFARTVINRELAKQNSRDQLRALAQAQAEAARRNKEPELQPPQRVRGRRIATKDIKDITNGFRLLPKANDRQREELDDQVEDLIEDARRPSPTNTTYDREIQL